MQIVQLKTTLKAANRALEPAADLRKKRPLGSTCDIGAVKGIANETSFYVIPLPNGKAVIIPL